MGDTNMSMFVIDVKVKCVIMHSHAEYQQRRAAGGDFIVHIMIKHVIEN